jgi:hypothetical protein
MEKRDIKAKSETPKRISFNCVSDIKTQDDAQVKTT